MAYARFVKRERRSPALSARPASAVRSADAHVPVPVTHTCSPSSEPQAVSRCQEVPILVVEDDPASARLVATVLSAEGATDVRVAHSAEEALAVVRDRCIHVLIVDVLLPGMNGLVLVRRLKSEQATRHIIAIAMSGLDGAGLVTEAIDSGCVALIQKPLELDNFLAILRATLVQAAGNTARPASSGGNHEST